MPLVIVILDLPLIPLADSIAERPEPDVADTHEGSLGIGMGVILQAEWSRFADILIGGAWGRSFDGDVVLNEDAVVQQGQSAGHRHLAAGTLGCMENDVV